MRRTKLGLGIVVAVWLGACGCRSPLVHEILEEIGRRDAREGGAARDGGVGTDVTEPGAIGDCGAVVLAAALRRTPEPPGQHYLRCATLGPEADWRVTLSPDARHLAARTSAGTVRLLQTSPWGEVAQLASALGQLDAVAFSPDGAHLATLSAEMGQVALWRTYDGALERTFAGPPASTIDAHTSALVFSAGGRRLATSLGTMIDLGTGVTTDWRTGAPVATTRAVNPQNLDTGEAIPVLAFSIAGTRLFVETRYQIGNSPTSVRLSLVEPGSGQSTVLFEMYTRALDGYALSADGRLVAVARTPEAQVGGFAPGLFVYDADTGALRTSAPSSSAQVLGFSPSGQRLYVRSGDTVTTLNSANLSPTGSFLLPPGTVFLGVSPTDTGGRVVGASGGATTWWNPESGAIVRSMPVAFTAVTWSANGRYGVGTGDPGALFRMWREADGQAICALPPTGLPAPGLAELGVTLDGTGRAVSEDGYTIATNEFVLHTHATDWTAVHVRDQASGTLLRVFGATPAPSQMALSRPDAVEIYTRQGADMAVWCR